MNSVNLFVKQDKDLISLQVDFRLYLRTVLIMFYRFFGCFNLPLDGAFGSYEIILLALYS